MIDTFIGVSVKSDRFGYVKGYLARFGSPESTDLENEFFTSQTDFGFPTAKNLKVPLNLYYHHGMDQKVGRKSIGTGFVKMDETGLWYEAQIDLADEYGRMIAKLAKEGKMGFSSGAAGHLVERKSVGNSAEITRWPIAEASITPTPAEWRNNVKSIEDYYGEMPEMEMEPMPEPPSEGMDPVTFAEEAFSSELKFEVLHEAIEAHYEALCTGIEGVAMMPAGERSRFIVELLNMFASRLGEMISQMQLDAKSFGCISPETLRGVERRLRDAIGLSRSEAKRLAPDVWNALRDAGQKEGTDFTPKVEQNTSTAMREDMLDRINYLLEIL